MRKIFAAFLILIAGRAVAQNAPYHMEKLAPGVHAVIREPAEGGASDSNVLIVVNEGDVVVVDSGKDLEATRTAVNVDAFREAFGGESQRQALEYLFVGPAIEAAYKQLRPGTATDH